MIDVDSFVGEVCGRLEQGASYGYTKLLGCHPILATRADTREVLHIRLRKGSANTEKGMLRFCEELTARVERAGATVSSCCAPTADPGTPRSSSASRRWAGSTRSVRMIKPSALPSSRSSSRLAAHRLPRRGRGAVRRDRLRGRRLVVRRTRLLGPQAELWPDWRHFAFITNRAEEIALVEASHREHAVVEQVIADLKDQALAHFPSGQFNANGPGPYLPAWRRPAALDAAARAPATTVRAARTLRRWLIGLPGRLTSHARGFTLHLPARWPGRRSPRRLPGSGRCRPRPEFHLSLRPARRVPTRLLRAARNRPVDRSSGRQAASGLHEAVYGRWFSFTTVSSGEIPYPSG